MNSQNLNYALSIVLIAISIISTLLNISYVLMFDEKTIINKIENSKLIKIAFMAIGTFISAFLIPSGLIDDSLVYLMLNTFWFPFCLYVLIKIHLESINYIIFDIKKANHKNIKSTFKIINVLSVFILIFSLYNLFK